MKIKDIQTTLKKHARTVKKGILPGLVILGMALALNYKPIQAYYDDGSTARGAFFGGITGAAIGGAAGGGTGAAIGGLTGFGLGGMIGASRARHRDPNYKLDKLYRRRDRLERNLHRAKSERRRARIQRKLDRVNDEIRSYERSFGIRPA